MVVLIDANLILDVLQKRIPFFDSSNEVLKYCASGKIKGYIALHSISNIFYILRNDFPDFEDCLQDECAKNVNADYIITRNTNDFSTSDTPAISPVDFIKMFNR